MPRLNIPKRRKVKGKGSRVFRHGDRIVSTTDRYVVSWGYDYEYADARKEVAKEVGIDSNIQLRSSNLEWDIFQQHPVFEKCREALRLASASFHQALSTQGFRYVANDKRHQYYASKYVRDFIYRRLRQKMKAGAERKIIFGTITKPPKHYTVREVKVIQTGIYYPPEEYGGGYDEDYEYVPGGLTDRKTYKLVCGDPWDDVTGDPPPYNTKHDGYTYWNGRRIWLLANDCRFLHEMQVAERLRGEKLKWDVKKVKDAV
jgi:hypothetical protein